MLKKVVGIFWPTELGLINDERFVHYHAAHSKPILDLRNEGALEIIEAEYYVVGALLDPIIALQVSYACVKGYPSLRACSRALLTASGEMSIPSTSKPKRAR